MIRTKDDTTSGIGTITGGPGAGRCLWDESVCVDTPTHFVTQLQSEGTEAEVFCVRHYVITLARMCQLHLPDCEGPFEGHVADHGEL